MLFDSGNSTNVWQEERFYAPATSVPQVRSEHNSFGLFRYDFPTLQYSVYGSRDTVPEYIEAWGRPFFLLRNFDSDIGQSLLGMWYSPTYVKSLSAHIAHARQLEAKGQVAKGMDIVFREIDTRLREGNFGECDELLNSIDISKLTPRMIMGLLSITLAASQELKYRRHFFSAARRELKLRGKDPNRLIGGLRGRRAANGTNLFAGGKAR
jgi:hypothetical protein